MFGATATWINEHVIFMQEHKFMSRKKVLIYVDQKRRDLYPMERIYYELSKYQNVSVRLAGKFDFLAAVRHFKPNVIVYGKSDGYHGDWLRCISGAIVFSINTEQGYGSKEDTVINFMEGHSYERKPAHEHVNYYLLGSDITKAHLADCLPSNKLLVVGYPRLIAKEFANVEKQVSKKLTIGIACGENIGADESIQIYYERYLNKSFGYLGDVRGFLSFCILDRCLTRYLVDNIKNKYQLVVRYRFGDSEYLLNEDGVEIDVSDNPIDFFKKCDLIIMGQSTIGVEAMMCGIPVISTVRLLNFKGIFDPVKEFSYINVCWQPDNINELMELVDARANGKLALAPSPDEYQSLVSNTYYLGGTVDRSVDNICKLVNEVAANTEAYLDVEKLHSLTPLPRKKRFMLERCGGRLSKYAYYLLLSYIRMRLLARRILKRKVSEIFVPTLSGDVGK